MLSKKAVGARPRTMSTVILNAPRDAEAPRFANHPASFAPVFLLCPLEPRAVDRPQCRPPYLFLTLVGAGGWFSLAASQFSMSAHRTRRSGGTCHPGAGASKWAWCKHMGAGGAACTSPPAAGPRRGWRRCGHPAGARSPTRCTSGAGREPGCHHSHTRNDICIPIY